MNSNSNRNGHGKKTDSLSASLPESSLSGYHIPVLFHETLAGLAIRPDGIYVDCTFGGGGHSAGILQQLGPDGRLFAFDQDADAQQNLQADPRLIFIPQNFRHLKRFLRLHNISGVDGILADLGVSSHQFDEAGRGFSIRFNADLDMRMDRRLPVTAFDIVQTYKAPELHKMFEQYGEVTNAKTLANTIVTIRDTVSLKTIDGFKNALRSVVKGNPNKYFAQVFQALRMEVNEEVPALKEMLEQTASLLKPGARIAVITFHSIEDRLVKTFFREGSFEKADENPFLNTSREQIFKIITKKPITATQAELDRNTRSRSAKLRIAERL